MSKRPLIWTLRIGVALAGALAVVIALLAGRLSQGPIELERFKPRLEAAMHKTFGAATSVRRLIVESTNGDVALSAFGVTVAGEDGRSLIRAARVNLDLSVEALLLGEFKPETLEIIGARLTAVRDPSGELQLLARANEPETAAPESAAPENAAESADLYSVARDWMAGDVDIPSIPDLRLKDAVFQAIDGGNGRLLWEGRMDAGLSVQDNRASIWSAVAFDPERGASPLRLTTTLQQGAGGHVTVALTKAKLPALAMVARLFGVELPATGGAIDGDASLSLTSALSPTDINLSVAITDFATTLPEGRQLALERLAIEAHADYPAGEVTITGVRLGKDERAVVGAAKLKPLQGGLGYVFSGRVDQAKLGTVAQTLGLSEQLQGLDVRLSADFDIRFFSGRLATAEAHIAADGQIAHESLRQSIAFRDTSAFIAYDAETGVLAVTGARANADGIEIAGEWKGTLAEEGGLASYAGKARVGAFSAATLSALWPKGFSPGGRAWVARNLLKGQVDRASLTITQKPGKPVDVAAEFKASGVDLRYWDPMPLATNVSGIGRIKGDRLELHVAQGRSGGMTTNDVVVRFDNLGGKGEHLTLDGAIRGPAANLLAVLNRKPLGYADWLGVAPEAVAGDINGRLQLNFPLIDRLSVDDIKITATGKTQGAYLPGVVNGWDLKNASVDLAVDTSRLKAEGTAELLDQPLSFAGKLNFGAEDERARFTGAWRVDRAVRREIGLGAPEIQNRLTGTAPARFDLTAWRGGRYDIAVNADLTNATLLFQDIGWIKPKGVKGTISAQVALGRDGPTRIDDIRLRTSNMLIDAALAFRPDGDSVALAQARIARLAGAGHDLAADIAFAPGGDAIRITGNRANLATLISNDNASPSKKGAARPPTRRTFDIALKEAVVTEALKVSNLKSQFSLGDGADIPADLTVSATYSNGQVTITPAKGGLTVGVSDFGAFLAAADVVTGISGGGAQLQVTPAGTKGVGLWLETEKLNIAKTTLSRITGGEADGLVQTLAETDAVPFDGIRGQAYYKAGRLDILESRLSGEAIGVTARGDVDFRSRTLNLGGAITPAYGFSRMLGAIPLLGDLLTGSRGEGLFAVNYRAAGSIDAPNVAVNQLSALAPGILREALDPNDPRSAGSTKPEPEETIEMKP